MQPNTGLTRKRIHNYGTTIINVSARERVASVALRLLFISRGIKKASLLRTAIGGYLVYRGASGHCPVYSQLQRNKYTSKAESVNIQTTLIVNKPKDEVYNFWRKLENLPLFMKHLKSVRELNGEKSHWEVKIPGNVTTLGWDAEIVKEEPGELIAWKSLPGATIENAGKVTFRDALGHNGTELTVVITYKPPAGYVGSTLAWLLHPLFRKTIEADVLGFKQYIEIGNIVLN
jgi:uncharacterized membrane protein